MNKTYFCGAQNFSGESSAVYKSAIKFTWLTRNYSFQS